MSEVRSLDGREVIWTPQPRQLLALQCPVDELMYGGQKGGGKSDYLIMCAYEQMALAEAKFRSTGRLQRGRAILFRKNLRHLDDLISRSKELFPSIDPQMGMNGWASQPKKWTFTSGYTFEFAHLDGPDDHEAYQGQEITALLFDQVEEVPFEVYLYLCGQVRSRDDDMRKLLMVRTTANPGGKYANWVKDYFVTPCKSGKIIREEVSLPSGRKHTVTKAFVPAKLADNKYLYNDPSYEARLAMMLPHQREMYLAGNWDVVVGAFFAGVLDTKVHFISSFSIPASWELGAGMDWGTNAPAAWELAARSPDGDVFFIDEIYGPGKTGRIFGERILNRFKNQRWSRERRWELEEIYTVLDKSTWTGHGGEGGTAAVSMQNMGIRFFPAENTPGSRQVGVEQWIERLTIENGKPKVYIFVDRCPALCRALQTLAVDPHNPNDVDTDGEDHAYDGARYKLMDWPVRPLEPEKQGDKDVARWLALRAERDRIQRTESVTGYD